MYMTFTNIVKALLLSLLKGLGSKLLTVFKLQHPTILTLPCVHGSFLSWTMTKFQYLSLSILIKNYFILSRKLNNDKISLPFLFYLIKNYYISSVADAPLPVYFKLPISEISEIDDHKSVSLFFVVLFYDKLNWCFSFYFEFLCFWSTDENGQMLVRC